MNNRVFTLGRDKRRYIREFSIRNQPENKDYALVVLLQQPRHADFKYEGTIAHVLDDVARASYFEQPDYLGEVAFKKIYFINWVSSFEKITQENMAHVVSSLDLRTTFGLLNSLLQMEGIRGVTLLLGSGKFEGLLNPMRKEIATTMRSLLKKIRNLDNVYAYQYAQKRANGALFPYRGSVIPEDSDPQGSRTLEFKVAEVTIDEYLDDFLFRVNGKS